MTPVGTNSSLFKDERNLREFLVADGEATLVPGAGHTVISPDR